MLVPLVALGTCSGIPVARDQANFPSGAIDHGAMWIHALVISIRHPKPGLISPAMLPFKASQSIFRTLLVAVKTSGQLRRTRWRA